MYRLLFDDKACTARPSYPISSRAGQLPGIQVATFPDMLPSMRDLIITWQRQAFARHETFAYVEAKPDIKAVFFDMDATAVREESINELAREAGTYTEVARITTAAMEGHVDFAVALHQRVAALQGLSLAAVDRVRQNLTINTGLRELTRFLHQKGVKTYLVSGGFTILAQAFANSLSFHGVLANELEHTEHQLTGRLQGPIVDAMAKRRFVEQRKVEYGWHETQVVVVGDGANDIPMMKTSAFPIGFQPKDALLPHLCCANYTGDHRLLIDLLW